jgi:dihydroorotate dehydrogenase
MAFKLDPEMAHNLGMDLLAKIPGPASTIWNQNDLNEKYAVNLNCGLKWPFPVGLAAGLDKEAKTIDFFSKLYFGAIEVGTVTPKPQEGNPKPRLFRLKKDESLLNRMGFNNAGMMTIKQNITSSSTNGKILGINLGKNKTTSAEDAKQDYQTLYREFSSIGDYLVVNVSSPNTPGLRDLQAKESLEEIFVCLENVRKENPVPLFVKVSPDMAKQGYEDVVELSLKYNLAGIIATNTSIMPERGLGGVSGELIKKKSKESRKYLLDLTKGTNLDIIGVGGISSFQDVKEFWVDGGKVVLVYN